MGAIIDPVQRKSVNDYVEQAKREGAEVYQACASLPSQGCFYPPTLITKVEPVSTCVQEEVKATAAGSVCLSLYSSIHTQHSMIVGVSEL